MVNEPDIGERRLEEYRGYLRLLARRLVGARLRAMIDPADIVQETLLQAHADRHQFRGKTKAQWKAWLRRILSNTIIDAVRCHGPARRPSARERSLKPVMYKSASPLLVFLVAEKYSPPERIILDEDLARVSQALGRLPDDQRTEVEMKHLYGYRVADIAHHMGRSRTAVGGLLRRGLNKLRQLLDAGQKGRKSSR